jgi:molybdopterin-guanine dinucleotide biosynthesis protein A
MPSDNLGVVILAGGQSRRMGTNKALLRLTPDSPTLIEQVVAVTAPLGPALLVTNTPEVYAFLGLPMVPDARPGTGALGGLYSGLRAARAPYNLVVACDMPFLQPALLGYLAAQPREYEVLIPRWQEPGRAKPQLETLHAIYSQSCLPAIEAHLDAGDLRMVSFFPDVRVRYVDEPELRQVDPTLHSFRNLNTPDELAQAGGGGVGPLSTNEEAK